MNSGDLSSHGCIDKAISEDMLEGGDKDEGTSNCLND